MGIYANAYRLPLDVAIDWLTVRTRFQDIDVDHHELLVPRHNCFQSAPDEPPRDLYMGRMSSDVLDLMTGAYHGPPIAMGRAFTTQEWDDPRAWAALGARLVGWPKDKLPLVQGADRFRTRYTLPQEIEAICDVLAEMTPADMCKQAEQAIADSRSEEAVRRWAPLDYEGDAYEGLEEQACEAAANLLLSLRQFYEAARAEGQIVIHDMR